MTRDELLTLAFNIEAAIQRSDEREAQLNALRLLPDTPENRLILLGIIDEQNQEFDLIVELKYQLDQLRGSL